uniref:Uncharacterized protein n=1 Tax=Solanum tuberosum TaxID=4113 RepID=M1BMB0_SOLTU
MDHPRALAALIMFLLFSVGDFTAVPQLRRKSQVTGGLCAHLIQSAGFPCTEHQDLPAIEYEEGINSKTPTVFKRGAHEKHVTSSNEIEKLGQLLKPNKEPIVSRKGGPGFSSLVIFNSLSNSNGLEQNRYISIETPEVQYLPGTYVARTLQKCQRMRVGFAKSSVFLENPRRVRHQK